MSCSGVAGAWGAKVYKPTLTKTSTIKSEINIFFILYLSMIISFVFREEFKFQSDFMLLT
jgi:hypothetical protein